MNLNESLVYWNPWWSGDGQWLRAVEREAVPHLITLLERKEILTISGVRRSGKTTILHLLAKSLLDKGTPAGNILHLNLEDPAFRDLGVFALYEKYLELMNPEGKVHLFLDEIQEADGWQRDLRKLYDGPRDVKLVISGSNSSLLKGENATLLTGRTLFCEVYPFSFREFVALRGGPSSPEPHLLLKEKTRLMHLFGEYLTYGGFPEVVTEPDPKVKRLLLKEYYNAILTRDVLRRYPVRQTARYESAAHWLISNTTGLFSAKGLAPALSINPTTLEEYLGFLEDVYLFFALKHFSFSVKKQLTYPRKVYCVDNGFIEAASFRFSDDWGKLLENQVHAELKRRGHECYYWKGKKECDFVMLDRGAVTSAIQVCHSLADEPTKKRELAGALEAMNEFGLDRGLILTREEFDTVKTDGKTIAVMPVWWWLLARE